MTSIHSTPISLMSLEQQDLTDLWNIITEHRENLHPWLDWVSQISDFEEYVGHMERVRYEESIGIQKHYVVRVEGKAAGEIVFDDFDASTRSCNLGYWLSPKYQNQGIMFTACVSAISQAFDSLNIDKVVIRFIETNKASFALAKKMGFKIDGILRKNIKYHGVLRDEVVMSCFRNEWKYGNENQKSDA